MAVETIMVRNNTLYLLRHAHTQIDSRLPASSWVLSEEGIRQAKAARASIGLGFDRIYSSEERKAIQTAEFFLSSSEEEIVATSLLNELNRDKGSSLSSDDYFKAVETTLANPHCSVHNWESAQSAHERFLQAIRQIDNENLNAPILIVSHGLVLSIYFAKALGQIEAVYERWKKLRFCSWGIVENKNIIKDIIV
ncbi:MAG: histidine phosphatase family protein [Candidatus Thorarchaeota archaeon]|nr:histidine phosphatase family protein [Candidatus Thorarchaeota archaeon]